jgi:hypothetical protein
MLSCGGDGGVCKPVPVDNVAIKATGGSSGKGSAAGVYRARTGRDGRYEMEVGKGVYEVSADAGRLRIRPGERRVNLRDDQVGTADFRACGIREGNASAAVNGGTWESNKRSCTDFVQARWRPSTTSLTVSWISAPRCAGAERDYTGPPKVLLREAAVRPGQRGHVLDNKPERVSFLRPIGAPEAGENLRGRLNRDGTGAASGTVHEGACTYGMSGLALTRGG